MTRLRYKQIKRLLQGHVVSHFCHHLQDFRLSGPDSGCYMITYCNLCLFFDQGELVLWASTDFVPALFLPKDDTEVQYPNSSCNKHLFLRKDPRSWQLIQKTVLQWIVSDDVFKNCSVSHMGQSSHNSSSGPFCLSHHVCCHQ